MDIASSESAAVNLQNHPAMASPENPVSTRPVAHDDPKTAKEIKTKLFSQFHNFDDPATYENYMTQATQKNTANFAVRFGVEKAEIAINLNEHDLGALLQVQAQASGKDKDEKMVCTWM